MTFETKQNFIKLYNIIYMFNKIINDGGTWRSKINTEHVSITLH